MTPITQTLSAIQVPNVEGIMQISKPNGGCIFGYVKDYDIRK